MRNRHAQDLSEKQEAAYVLTRPVRSGSTLEDGPRCNHGAAARAHVHGGKGKLTGESLGEGVEKVAQRGVRRGSACRSGDAAFRQRRQRQKARRRDACEEARRQGCGEEEEPPPLPYL